MKILLVIMFCCFSASTASPGSPPSITPLWTEAVTPPRDRSPSSTEPSPAASTLPAEATTNQAKVSKLTDTTVVIIVSVTLAVLVCAVIPFIYYGHCRSNRGELDRPEANKDEGGYLENSAGVASVQTQTLPSSDQDPAAQYANVYQNLDSKSLD